MHTNTTQPAPRGVDPEELDRHIAQMYRDVANEADRDLHFPTGRPLAQALGYESRVRRPQRLAAGAQAAGRISPHLRPIFGWWRPCRRRDPGGGVHQHNDDSGGLEMSAVTDTVRNGVDTEKLTSRVAT